VNFREENFNVRNLIFVEGQTVQSCQDIETGWILEQGNLSANEERKHKWRSHKAIIRCWQGRIKP
jgi:hypothetical protein